MQINFKLFINFLFLFCLFSTQIAATGGALAAGTALGWSSPTEERILHDEYGFTVSKADWSLIGSLVTLGAALICTVIGPICQMLGRKLTMLLLVIPFTIGYGLVIFASNVIMLMIGRFLLGISGGAFCVAAPIYTAEIAQPEIRGSLGGYFQLMLVIGVLFSYIVGKYLSVFAFTIVCAIIPLIFGAIFSMMPETPVHLISKGRKSDAQKSLQWLRGSQYDCKPELDALQAAHEEAQQNKVPLLTALKRKSTIRAVFISLGLMFFQQMSGINAVIFFTGSIFEATGSSIDSGIATIIVGVMQVVAVFVSTLIVDKLGRRLLLLPSIIVMALCTGILGGYFYAKSIDEASVANIGIVPIVAMCVFIVLFSLGFGPIPWMMMGELFANDIKSVAGSAAGTFNWLLAFLVTSTFKSLVDTFGDGPTFWIFSAFCIVGIVFTLIFVPETKGKSLEEIQLMLGGEKSLTQDGENGNGTSDSKF